MLSGSILPGITRKSVVALAKQFGLKVAERKISIDEVINAHTAGTLKEIFGSGTAAVVSPVGELKFGDHIITVGDGSVGALSQKLYDEIQRIQFGQTPDPFGWIEPVC